MSEKLPEFARAEEALHRVFGFADFRPGQREIVEAIVGGQDVLAVMPTGAGKSLCYQLPALLRDGVTVVVSPLIALMRDQVEALRALGIGAAALNSANGAAGNARTFEMLREQRLSLVYCAPERLALADTRNALAAAGVGLLAVDEAHCVSKWGHDFRADYLTLGEARAALGEPQTVAFTATADAATRQEIAERLFKREPKVFVHGFDRPNLRLAMAAKESTGRQLLSFLRGHRGESGIVYRASRKKTEDTAAMLNQEGFRAVPYHAGMEAAERTRNQDLFQREDGVIVVATIAFGMGIDKPDVRFVCHGDLPKDIESYYQEIGRAGRDGLPANTLTLYGLDDMRVRRMQIDESEAAEEQKRAQRQRLNALVSLCEAPRCRRQTLLAYFGETVEPCGNCDLCLEGIAVIDGTVEAQKALSAMVRTGERFGTEHLVSLLVGEGTESIQRFRHDRLPTFGVGKDRDKREWRAVLRQINALGLATMDISEYGRWVVGERGWAVLRGKERVEMRDVRMTPRQARKEAAARKVRAAIGEQAMADVDGDLLSELKALRNRIARGMGMAAYMVFPDRTLLDFARLRPATPEAMLACHGVGEAKMARHGATFLEAIRAHQGGSGA
ncbi:MAG: DNA helicase RecQ [Alphaproteobacteria bacterium]|nr:DNA helicase RecQ [Alphaproteobacteria bacterium]MCW5743554.1 DNA helicase RecQ [Alphaproteobacteria bacterium]